MYYPHPYFATEIFAFLVQVIRAKIQYIETESAGRLSAKNDIKPPSYFLHLQRTISMTICGLSLGIKDFGLGKGGTR